MHIYVPKNKLLLAILAILIIIFVDMRATLEEDLAFLASQLRWCDNQDEVLRTLFIHYLENAALSDEIAKPIINRVTEALDRQTSYTEPNQLIPYLYEYSPLAFAAAIGDIDTLADTINTLNIAMVYLRFTHYSIPIAVRLTLAGLKMAHQKIIAEQERLLNQMDNPSLGTVAASVKTRMGDGRWITPRELRIRHFITQNPADAKAILRAAVDPSIELSNVAFEGTIGWHQDGHFDPPHATTSIETAQHIAAIKATLRLIEMAEAQKI